MKRFLILAMLGSLTATAFAQIAGLPVADTALGVPQGSMRASAGAVMGDDINLYGARLAFGAADRLTAFGDAGIVDPDDGDSGWGIQGGLAYKLLLDVPFDLAARGTLGYASADQQVDRYDVDLDIVTINVGALASKPLTDALTLYGYLGLNYSRFKESANVRGMSFSETETETDAAVGGGAILALNDRLSLYGELMHIDDLWIGFGARMFF